MSQCDDKSERGGAIFFFGRWVWTVMLTTFVEYTNNPLDHDECFTILWKT